MKKIIFALIALTSLSQTLFAQQVSIATEGKPVMLEGMQYAQYKEQESYGAYTFKCYATVKDGKLILSHVKTSESGMINEIQVNTVELDNINFVSQPEATETNGSYTPEIYSALVALKQGKECNTKNYNYQGDKGSENNWNYPLFFKTPSNDNITAISKAIKQGNMNGILFTTESNTATKNTTTSQETSNSIQPSTTTKAKATEQKEIRIELQNTSKETIYLKYEGGINGSSFIGAGTINSFKGKPGAKILNKKTGAVYITITESTKSNTRIKI